MKYFDLEDYIKNLNSFFNDEELNRLHERLRYPIGAMTTKEKYNIALEMLTDIKNQYNKRITELINEKFNLKIKGSKKPKTTLTFFMYALF